jgi:AP-4 complex subunit mu-1
MLSQLFILSQRGDTIITRDFRGDLSKGSNEIFFRHVKKCKGSAPPVFNIEGINFLHLKRSSLYIVVTSKHNPSPSFVFEMMVSLSKIIKDFCGVLTEESIRKNFVLVYEIIDELVDFGYPQSVSTEQVRPYIVNDPVIVEPPKSQFTPSFITPNTVPSSATQRSVKSKKKKNEIFVDVFEKVSVLFNASGYVVNSSIEGCIQMKSFLTGNPQLRLALNDDLVCGRGSGAYGSVVLDDYNFHESVNSAEFEEYKILTINPPDGEFTVMNYRARGDYQTPFRITPFIEQTSPYKIELQVKVRACYPETQSGTNVTIKCTLPKTASSVGFELPTGLSGQTSEFKDSEKIAEWGIKKFLGGKEYTAKFKIAFSQPANRKEVGPISMDFEISMFNFSNLQIKYLRIADQGKSSNPHRWVRYVTQASSYVCRI